MRSWSPAAEDKLRRLYATTPMAELCFQLKRTPKAINSRAKRLGLRKVNRMVWTKAQERILRKRFPNEPAAAIARDLGCSAEQASQKATKLGLHKSEAYMRGQYAEDRRRHAMTDLRCIAGRIKPGTTPPNKGLRRPGYAPGRSGETQFKKGCMSGAAQHNYVPVGTLRISSRDGYLERKVTDDHPVPARRWVAVHRLVWEAANGPIPPGHRVAFKPGTRTAVLEEITADKLELVTAADLMRRNTYHNYPKEIGLAIHAKAVLQRAINKHNRGTSHE